MVTITPGGLCLQCLYCLEEHSDHSALVVSVHLRQLAERSSGKLGPLFKMECLGLPLGCRVCCMRELATFFFFWQAYTLKHIVADGVVNSTQRETLRLSKSLVTSGQYCQYHKVSRVPPTFTHSHALIYLLT